LTGLQPTPVVLLAAAFSAPTDEHAPRNVRDLRGSAPASGAAPVSGAARSTGIYRGATTSGCLAESSSAGDAVAAREPCGRAHTAQAPQRARRRLLLELRCVARRRASDRGGSSRVRGLAGVVLVNGAGGLVSMLHAARASDESSRLCTATRTCTAVRKLTRPQRAATGQPATRAARWFVPGHHQ
jgi:hypothetical protein